MLFRFNTDNSESETQDLMEHKHASSAGKTNSEKTSKGMIYIISFKDPIEG